MTSAVQNTTYNCFLNTGGFNDHPAGLATKCSVLKKALQAAFAGTSLAISLSVLAQPVISTASLSSTIVAPPGTAVGTLVYNTAAAGSGATQVKPGAYVWSGTEWRLADAHYFNTNSALGNSQANGLNSVAVGPASIAGGSNGVAAGTRATSTGSSAIAIGVDSAATGVGGVGSVAIGGGDSSRNGGNVNDPAGSTRLNIANRAGTAVGFGSQSTGAGDGGGSAFGTYANANNGAYNTAIGYRADASAPGAGAANPLNPTYSGAVVLGAFSIASAPGATVLGANSSASAPGGVAIGNFSSATRVFGSVGYAPAGASAGSITVINATNSTFLGAVSVGGGSLGATQLGTRQITNVAAGTNDTDAVNVSQLRALSNVVVGLPAGGAGAQGPQGVPGLQGPAGTPGTAGATGTAGPVGAMGATGQPGPGGAAGQPGPVGATGSQGPSGVAVPAVVVPGSNIVASINPATNQLNIGTTADATFTGLATGNLSVGPAASVSMGNNVVTQVAAGVAAGDAVNVSQLTNSSRQATEQATEQARQYTDNRFNQFNQALGQMAGEIALGKKDASAGTAGAMAMAGMPQAFAPGKSMASAGVASYDGQTALAVGMSRLSESGRWLMKVNGSANTRGKAGVSVGAGFSW